MDAEGVSYARGPCCVAFPVLVERPRQGNRRKWGTVWYCSGRLLHPSDEPLNMYTKGNANT